MEIEGRIIHRFIIYGSELPNYREFLRRGMMVGLVRVVMDFNHGGGDPSKPEDSIIYRVYVGEFEPLGPLFEETNTPEQNLV